MIASYASITCANNRVTVVTPRRRIFITLEWLYRQREGIADAALGPDYTRRARVDLELALEPQHLDIDASIENILVADDDVGCEISHHLQQILVLGRNRVDEHTPHCDAQPFRSRRDVLQFGNLRVNHAQIEVRACGERMEFCADIFNAAAQHAAR
jgi:hypothetical protein